MLYNLINKNLDKKLFYNLKKKNNEKQYNFNACKDLNRFTATSYILTPLIPFNI